MGAPCGDRVCSWVFDFVFCVGIGSHSGGTARRREAPALARRGRGGYIARHYRFAARLFLLKRVSAARSKSMPLLSKNLATKGETPFSLMESRNDILTNLSKIGDLKSSRHSVSRIAARESVRKSQGAGV